jgi:hypothetical protein
MGTACWRGHVATWHLEGDDLLLHSINGNLMLDAPLFADWITTTIELRNDARSRVHSRTTPRYTTWHALVIEAGKLIREERYVWDAVDQIRRDYPSK